MSANPLPAIGWHKNVPAEVYHSWKLASNSRLNLFERSPAHLEWSDRHPVAPTPALAFGSAIHCALLEPKEFDKRFVRDIEGDGRSTAVKAARAELRKLHSKATVLSVDDFDAIPAIVQAVKAHPTAGLLVESATDLEISGVFQEPKSGALCKMRFDFVSEEFSAIVDLKTTEDASRRSYARSVENWRYYRQGGIYRAGAAVLGRHYQEFVHIVVEKSAPHFVACYRFTPEYLDLGYLDAVPLLEFYRECEESGCWPAYDENLQDLTPPKWLAEKHKGSWRQES